MTVYIFPTNPLTERGVDEEFVKEAELLKWEENTQVATVNHDSLTRESFIQLRNLTKAEGACIYRGWMVSAEEYALLHAELEARNLTLQTTAEQYRTAHHIDGWLEAFKGLTFGTVLVDATVSEEELRKAVTGLNSQSFFIKDYVKSLKHNGEASVAQNIDDLYPTIKLFLEEQSEWLVGGLAIREFVPLPESRVEIRGWWKADGWRAFTPHPDYSGEEVPAIPQGILNDVSDRLTELNLNFVSVDFVFTSAGEWKVIEIGDGQVSGFPSSIAEKTILDILL